MSQHVTKTCDEGDGLWLPLIEYSLKSGVSTSTVRRQIKRNSIPYRLENGRYLILFRGKVAANPPIQTRSQPAMSEPAKVVPFPQKRPVPTLKPVPKVEPVVETQIPKTSGAPVMPQMDYAVKMVTNAYEHTLKEKDKRIELLESQNRQLKEEINELRLLIQVIEEKYNVRY